MSNKKKRFLSSPDNVPSTKHRRIESIESERNSLLKQDGSTPKMKISKHFKKQDVFSPVLFSGGKIRTSTPKSTKPAATLFTGESGIGALSFRTIQTNKTRSPPNDKRNHLENQIDLKNDEKSKARIHIGDMKETGKVNKQHTILSDCEDENTSVSSNEEVKKSRLIRSIGLSPTYSVDTNNSSIDVNNPDVHCNVPKTKEIDISNPAISLTDSLYLLGVEKSANSSVVKKTVSVKKKRGPQGAQQLVLINRHKQNKKASNETAKSIQKDNSATSSAEFPGKSNKRVLHIEDGKITVGDRGNHTENLASVFNNSVEEMEEMCTSLSEKQTACKNYDTSAKQKIKNKETQKSIKSYFPKKIPLVVSKTLFHPKKKTSTKELFSSEKSCNNVSEVSSKNDEGCTLTKVVACDGEKTAAEIIVKSPVRMSQVVDKESSETNKTALSNIDSRSVHTEEASVVRMPYNRDVNEPIKDPMLRGAVSIHNMNADSTSQHGTPEMQLTNFCPKLKMHCQVILRDCLPGEYGKLNILTDSSEQIKTASFSVVQKSGRCDQTENTLESTIQGKKTSGKLNTLTDSSEQIKTAGFSVVKKSGMCDQTEKTLESSILGQKTSSVYQSQEIAKNRKLQDVENDKTITHANNKIACDESSAINTHQCSTPEKGFENNSSLKQSASKLKKTVQCEGVPDSNSHPNANNLTVTQVRKTGRQVKQLDYAALLKGESRTKPLTPHKVPTVEGSLSLVEANDRNQSNKLNQAKESPDKKTNSSPTGTVCGYRTMKLDNSDSDITFIETSSPTGTPIKVVTPSSTIRLSKKLSEIALKNNKKIKSSGCKKTSLSKSSPRGGNLTDLLRETEDCVTPNKVINSPIDSPSSSLQNTSVTSSSGRTQRSVKRPNYAAMVKAYDSKKNSSYLTSRDSSLEVSPEIIKRSFASVKDKTLRNNGDSSETNQITKEFINVVENTVATTNQKESEKRNEDSSAQTDVPKTCLRKRKIRLAFPKKVQCYQCKKIYFSIRAIKHHMMCTHYRIWTEDCPEGKCDDESLRRVLRVVKSVMCPKCEKKFNYFSYYLFHKEWCGRENEKTICEICNNEIGTMWFKAHLHNHKVKDKRIAIEETAVQEALQKDTKTHKREAARKAIDFVVEVSRQEFNESAIFNNDEEYAESIEGTESSEPETEDDQEKKVKTTWKGTYSSRYKSSDLLQPDLYDEMLSFMQQQEKGDELYSEWMPSSAQWKRLKAKECNQYLPELQTSVHFTVESYKVKLSDDHLTELKLFQSVSHKSGCVSLFTGGPIRCLKWCPVPTRIKTDQYLAVAPHLKMNIRFDITKCCFDPGGIQIWHFPSTASLTTSCSNKKQNPSIKYVIGHNGGIVHCLEWCPSKVWQPVSSQTDDCKLTRLGLLAAGCSDGTVKIYSIPHNVEVKASDRSSSLPVYTPKPVITLIPNYFHSDYPGHCLSLSWSSVNDNRYILAGYAQGHVRIWDLATTSVLLKLTRDDGSQDLLSCRMFLGHTRSVTGVVWSKTSGKHFMTASHDHLIKYWDMTDTCNPVHTGKQGIVTNVAWMTKQSGVMFSCDLANGLYKNHSKFQDSGFEDPDYVLSSPVTVHNATSWGVSASDLLSCVICSDGDGLIMAHRYGAFNIISDNKKIVKRRFILSKCFLKRKISDDESDIGVDASNISGSELSEKENIEEPIAAGNQQTNYSANIYINEDDTIHQKEERPPKIIFGHIKPEVERVTSYKDVKEKFYLEFLDPNLKEGAPYADVHEAMEFHSDVVKGRYLDLSRGYHFNCLDEKREKLTFARDIPVEDFIQYPIKAMYSIEFNPNSDYCSWCAYGGEAGIIRVHNMQMVISKQAKSAIGIT